LKVRVISKMDPYLMTLFKPLQNWMHSSLKRNRAFRLIGEPTNWEYVQDVFGANNQDELISSDYSAATDNLHSWCSELVVREITAKIYSEGNGYYGLLRDEFQELLTKTLTEHDIVIMTGKKKDISIKSAQTKGQLMGSITSFPILCLINAGVNRLLFERKDKLESLKMCINGDDIVIAAGCTLAKHRELNSYVGSKLSPGKVFISKKFLNINSRFIIHTNTGKVIEKVAKRNEE